MTSIPLAAFLLELSTDGFHLTVQDYQRIGLALQTDGSWTIIRLRSVLNALLAKDPEQSLCFLRRFDDFFDLTVQSKSGKQNIDVSAILAEVNQLQNNEIPQSVAKERLPPLKSGQTATTKSPDAWYLSFSFILPAAGLLLFIGYVFIQLLSPPVTTINTTPIEPEITSIPQNNEPEKLTPTEPAQRVYSNVPVVKKITHTPIKGKDDWKYSMAIALCLLVITGFYAVYIWVSRQTPKDKGDKWDSTQPRHFAKERIGGKPAPRLNPETLAHLADSMGYFQSEQYSKQLDVPASVSATMDKGGIPALHFDKRRQLRQLIILVDSFAEALAWNPIATELEQGLSLLGVPLLYGQFRGAPDEILTEDGNTIYLDDLDSNRNGYLLLIFSDGKGLRPHHRQLLEAINRWPMKAWMELRAKEFWDESAALPARYGIDLYPASAEGLLSAFAAFLTERGAETESKEQVISNTAATAGDLHHKLETLLADTLPLAQACAMMQPITLGLVDALRREFYPNLAVERVERLIAIPGTTRTATGLQFSDSVLAILRADFAIRRTELEQEQVLHFLLRHIDAVEPAAKGSPAHLSWELTRTRIALELAPDQALKRLSELSQSPLHNTIQAELEKVVQPGQIKQAGNKDFSPIPLRKATTTRDGRQRLGQLAKNSGIAPLVSYPVAKKHWAGLSAFILIFVVFFDQAWERYNTLIERKVNIKLVNSEPNYVQYGFNYVQYQFEHKVTNGWKPVLIELIERPILNSLF